MRKILVLAAVLSLSITAFADTRAIFGRNDSKATVLMLAMSQNPDSIAFFEALSQPAAEEGGRLTKRFQFTDTQGIKTFTVVCAFSKIAGSTGSCTVVFYPGQGVYISGQEGRIRYDLKGEDAVNLAGYFVLPAESGEAFHSSDNQLIISVERSKSDQSIVAFSLQYGS